MDFSALTTYAKELFDFFKAIFGFAPFTTLVGIWLGAQLVTAREDQKDRRRYIEKQLSEFYGPLFTIVVQVEDCQQRIAHLVEAKSVSDSDGVGILRKEVGQVLSRNYKKIHELMTTKLWLAEPSTVELSYLINNMMAGAEVISPTTSLDTETTNMYYNQEGLNRLCENIRKVYEELSMQMKPPSRSWLYWLTSSPRQLFISRTQDSVPDSDMHTEQTLS